MRRPKPPKQRCPGKRAGAAASTPPARSRSTSGGGPPPAWALLRSLAASLSSFRAMASAKASSGVGGLDPARYGDWEIKGLTADF